tara:strand:- start:852 stop:1265 length:414 start_codon:yes stop_codon:yes gene_type:complete
MADATGYDPKNISGMTTLYVVPTAATNPIYPHPYTTGEIAAFDGFTGGSGYSAGTVTPTGGTGTGATATITVSGGAVNGATIVNKGKNYTDDDVLTVPGGNGAGRITVNGVSDGQTDTELSPHQDVCAAGTLSTSSW